MANANANANEEKQENIGEHTILLPNGQKRIDYIRDRYYNDGATRGEIKTEINTMLAEAGREGEQIPYQIVYSATPKHATEDPRIATEARRKKAAEEKAKKEAAEKEAAAAKKEADEAAAAAAAAKKQTKS